MGKIEVDRGAEQGPRAALTRPREAWDPFRSMRDLLRWDPFGEGLHGLERAGATFAPAFDVRETKDAYEFRADVPGVDAKDLDVKLSQNRLTISGKREAEKSDHGDTYYTYERSHGGFTRQFTMPEGVDAEKITADLKDGVLKVLVPKKADAQSRKVEVKAT